MKTKILSGTIFYEEGSYFFYSSLGPIYIINLSGDSKKWLPNYDQKVVVIKAQIFNSKINILNIKTVTNTDYPGEVS